MGPEVSVYLKPFNAVYVEIPKVACTSLKVAIAQLLGIDLGGADGDPHQVDFPSIDYNTNPSTLFPGYFSFAFVRNPWDRLVSCYRDKVAGEVDGFTYSTIRAGIADCLARFDAFTPDMAFNDFVDAVASIPDTEADEHFRSQYTFIINRDDAVAVNYLGRYETLPKDLRTIQQRTGMPAFTLPHLQAAATQVAYSEYYNDRTRKIVAERYASDIDMFEYQFCG